MEGLSTHSGSIQLPFYLHGTIGHDVLLKPMFENMGKRYDLTNRLITWGLDQFWRGFAAKECASGRVILDLCCGSGDLMLMISRYSHPGAYIVGLDFSKPMLRTASRKKESETRRRGAPELPMDFVIAEAAHLPFRGGSIDRIGMTFSFRNLVYKNPRAEASLTEALRALRKNGKLVFVETSQPRWSVVRALYHQYLRRAVPLIGRLISGRRGAYRYLGVSAANFHNAEEVVDLLSKIGFRDVSFKCITMGLVARHIGVK